MLNKLVPHLAAQALEAETDRRTFLVGATAVAGGLMVGLGAGPLAAATKETANPLTGYIHITPDNKVTVLSSQFDMGQGPHHGLSTLVVEELGADWAAPLRAPAGRRRSSRHSTATATPAPRPGKC